MKFLRLFLIFLLAINFNGFSQKVIKHTVKSGESIYLIAKKYNVTEAEVFELNPKLRGAILPLKATVQIPNKNFKVKQKSQIAEKSKIKEKKESNLEANKNSNTHLVLSKETLYSISKKYKISMETLCELNPELKTGTLKVGSQLKLPSNNEISKLENENKKEIQEIIIETKAEDIQENVALVHKVLPKETLYKISKIYKVSVKDLQELNPKIGSDLPIGYDLVIKKGSKPEENIVIVPADSTESNKENAPVKPLSLENMSKAAFLIAKASEHIGTRYRSGGTTSAGFDCSGLMFTTFKEIDMTLPRSSHEMARYGQKIDKSQAQKGDLIFFATFGRGRVSHVGMVTETDGDEIKFIHSSTSSGVIISSTKEDYYSRTFVQVNRVLQE